MKELEINVDYFNLKYTLECGQCFRWKKIDEDYYIGIIKDRVIKIKQDKNKLFVLSNNYSNLEKVVREYFELDKDYKIIEERISKVDEYVEKAVKNTSGLRHLKQDFFETIISYIISANNNIPRISKSVKVSEAITKHRLPVVAWKPSCTVSLDYEKWVEELRAKESI